MKYIEGSSREQITFLPDCVEDYVPENSPVRIIDAFVEGLDISEFRHSTLNDTGRPPYNPRDLLKLYIYGYFNRIRSSRKLMEECGRNIELFFLLNRLKPDFRTIADFRKDNAAALKKVFSEFVKVCVKLGLYKRELISVDGSKFRAVNSDDNCYNAEILRKKLARIDENISKYLSRLDENDRSEEDTPALSAEQIKEVVAELKQRREKYEGYLKQLDESGKTQILTTDPEAHRMHSRDGFHCCYNVQTAVDGGSHLIAGYNVTGQNTDQGLLNETVSMAKEALDTEVIEAVADKGYESRADILNCIYNGIIPNVDMKYDKKERVFDVEYEENEITEEERSSTRPEDIQKCIKAGVLPDCYKGSAISVEVREEGTVSCFIRNPDGTVTCPMGNILTKVKTRGRNTIYSNKDACRQCANRCTSGRGHKTVSFGPDTKVVLVRMFASPDCKCLKPPLKAVPHNSFYRKDKPKKKVIIRLKPDRKKLKERKCLSEHPFGTVKWHHGAYYLLCKGKEKVSAELGLSFLAYNLKRALNIAGFDKLLAAIKG